MSEPALVCELCHSPMSCTAPTGSAVRYYHCTGCGRWLASSYGAELVRAHTARERRPAPAAPDLSRVKESLARWMEALDQRDPYFVLGVPPSADPEAVRARFKELALQHHPDKGGDPAQMRRLLAAYERIRRAKHMDEQDEPAVVRPGSQRHRR